MSVAYANIPFEPKKHNRCNANTASNRISMSVFKKQTELEAQFMNPLKVECPTNVLASRISEFDSCFPVVNEKMVDEVMKNSLKDYRALLGWQVVLSKEIKDSSELLNARKLDKVKEVNMETDDLQDTTSKEIYENDKTLNPPTSELKSESHFVFPNEENTEEIMSKCSSRDSNMENNADIANIDDKCKLNDFFTPPKLVSSPKEVTLQTKNENTEITGNESQLDQEPPDALFSKKLVEEESNNNDEIVYETDKSYLICGVRRYPLQPTKYKLVPIIKTTTKGKVKAPTNDKNEGMWIILQRGHHGTSGRPFKLLRKVMDL